MNHILLGLADEPKATWCGGKPDGWHFLDATHAMLSMRRENPIEPCLRCLAAMRKAMASYECRHLGAVCDIWFTDGHKLCAQCGADFWPKAPTLGHLDGWNKGLEFCIGLAHGIADDASGDDPRANGAMSVADAIKEKLNISNT